MTQGLSPNDTAALGPQGVDVVLRDGSTVHVRPIRRDDEPRILALLQALSLGSRQFRFFSAAVNLEDRARQISRVDHERFGLLAMSGPDETLVGEASYYVFAPDRAEVAFTVADSYQGRGLGTILLGLLAEIAADRGISEFEAEVLSMNHQMIGVFRKAGFPLTVSSRPDSLHLSFPTAFSAEALERYARREQIGAANALHAFLCPRAVAVIGASRQRGTVGGEVFHNLLASEFAGPVYPVNPSAPVVQSVLAYPSVEAAPGPVDLAIISVPAAQVIPVAEQCARKGVRALVVLSAGFSEIGQEGRERQIELVRVCRAAGMRLIGPNCFGIINTDPDVRLNATFGTQAPPAGRVGFASQSGGLGLALIDYAGSRGLGLSSFVSMGNKADISGNDLLNYWETDPQTDVILLYLESFGNPRKFSRIARRVARQKPIVAVKSGRTATGARATASHTGAMLAASDITIDALFEQAGVIRTNTLDELFDMTTLLAHQPLPGGGNVAIVTNAGGLAIMCADACEAAGLRIPELSPETQARLRELLAAEASVRNPVDMIAGAGADHYRLAISLVANDPNVDAVIAIYIPAVAGRANAVALALVDAARALNEAKPLLAVFTSSGGVPTALKTAERVIPTYAFPESAATALGRVARYSAWRQRPEESPPELPGLRRDEAAAIVAQALGQQQAGWLRPESVARLLACYGLPLVEQRMAATPAEAAAQAEALGGPVAVKGVAPGLIHKTDVGAVVLDMQGASAVRQTAEAMRDRLTAAGHPPSGFLLQPMVPKGVELFAGLVHDPQFGPVIACGAGGELVELLKDVVVRLTPLTAGDTDAMLQRLKIHPLLTGYRGRPPADLAALRDLLLRLSALAEDLPDVAELDFNPIIAHERGAVIVDARIRIQPSAPLLPFGARAWHV